MITLVSSGLKKRLRVIIYLISLLTIFQTFKVLIRRRVVGNLARLLRWWQTAKRRYSLHRSSGVRLVAAGLAALLDHYPEGTVGILTEGGLITSTPKYLQRVESTLTSLVGRERYCFMQRDNVNLIGAACAALTAH